MRTGRLVVALAELVTLTFAACTAEHPPPSPVANGRYRWCVKPGEKFDSSFVAAQAIGALRSGGDSTEVVVREIQNARVGFVVTLVPMHLGQQLGGGGVVWVDAESGCSILLRLIE